jgi:uncharacterized iron-regulated membrane protein
MAKSKHYYIRKAHRYLGVLLGIQFLFWTVSGMYFSWSNMDEIHGDFDKKAATFLPTNLKLVSPDIVFEELVRKGADSIISMQLVNINGKPVYQVRYVDAAAKDNNYGAHPKIQLADALTGALRPALSKEEAVELAISRFKGNEAVKSIVYLSKTDGHHEYRESPLPAFGITFNNGANTTVYIASELGTVQSFRNNKWRLFDFLWMTHTMDYQSRDNISNLLLRIFSVFGLITVISGFGLYFISSKRFRTPRTPHHQQDRKRGS